MAALGIAERDALGVGYAKSHTPCSSPRRWRDRHGSLGHMDNECDCGGSYTPSTVNIGWLVCGRCLHTIKERKW